MQKELNAAAQKFGDRAVVCDVGILDAVKNDVETLKTSNHYGEAAKIVVKHFYNFNLPETDFPINSLVLVAKTEPIVNVAFCLDGREVTLYTKNAYKDARKPHEQPGVYLHKLFEDNGFRLQEWGWGIPLKILAVRSGLARYGRNNLAYVDGLGSRHSLSLFVSDAECGQISVFELGQMDSCATCRECLNACPTMAISTDREQIFIERCLTYLNEFVGLCDFPDWLSPTAHHSTQGCIRCQLSCPVNGDVKRIITPIRFDESETKLLLSGAEESDLSEETRNKLQAINELEYLHLLPRNLAAALDNME